MKKSEKVVAAMTPDTVKINVGELPKHETDALCRVLLRSVAEAFKNPAFAAEYEAWKAERSLHPGGRRDSAPQKAEGNTTHQKPLTTAAGLSGMQRQRNASE